MAFSLADQPFEVENFLDRYKPKAGINLASSSFDSLRLEDLLAFASDDQRRRFYEASLDYGPHRGSPPLIESIARRYDPPMGVADIALTSGAQEGIFIALSALLPEGGNAVIVMPGYHSISAIAEQHVPVRQVVLDERDSFRLSLDALFAAVDDKTVLIALNFPNNPTASTLPRADLDEIIQFSRRRGIWLLCDEVYRGVELDPSWTLPSIAELYERGIAIDGLSKRSGVPGVRIGWLACRDRAFLDRCRTLRSYLSVCSSSVVEIVAEIALDAAPPGDMVRKHALENLHLLQEFAAAHPERLQLPDRNATIFAFPRLSSTSTAFWQRLLAATDVLVLPGYVFNHRSSRYDDRFRVNIGRAISADGIRRLLEFLATE